MTGTLQTLTTGCRELAISVSCIGLVCEVFFTCSFSLAYFFSVLESNYNYFFHCIFVDDEKLYQYELYQRAKNQYDDKEILHGLRLINNGTSI